MTHAKTPPNEFGRTIESAAANYEQYMLMAYETNQPLGSLNQHLLCQQAVFTQWVQQAVSQDRRQNQSINLTIIGPGPNPVGREIPVRWPASFLESLTTIKLVDLSANFLSSTRQHLRTDLAQPLPAFFPMECIVDDVTAGLSRHYHGTIQKLFDGVGNLAAFRNATNRLACIDWGALSSTPRGDTPWTNHHCESNLVHIPMVLAGTGAASEKQIWDCLQNVTRSSTNHTGDHRNIQRIHDSISRYNLAVANHVITSVLCECPTSSVLITTDVNTHDKHSARPPCTRLNVSTLSDSLSQTGIHIQPTEPTTWNWDDSPDHWHTVEGFVCTRDLQELHTLSTRKQGELR